VEKNANKIKQQSDNQVQMKVELVFDKNKNKE